MRRYKSKVKVTTNLPRQTAQAVADLAQAEDRSQADILREATRRFLRTKHLVLDKESGESAD